MNTMNPPIRTNVALKRIKLKDLEPNLDNILIIAIIIGKKRPRIIKNSSAVAEKAVWNFTVRDSLQNYVNVNYWDGPEEIFKKNEKFSTGDVVQLINPLVILRNIENPGERFHPMVTSPFNLSLNETSDMIMHPNKQPFEDLLRIPTKPTAMYVPIHDIHNRGGAFESVDVLGAIRGLNEVRTITTKNNDSLQLREIELFDHTSSKLLITLWEPDLINRSNFWKPRATILFLTDLSIDWNDYKKAYVGKTTSRTIVTENPASKDARDLYNYAQLAPIETFDIVDRLISAIPPANDSEDILTVHQIHEHINNMVSNNSRNNKPFTFLIFAFVTALDLDGLRQTLIIKCSRCKIQLSNVEKCENPECVMRSDNDQQNDNEINFDIRISLSDHTGTVLNCALRGKFAEDALQCSAKEFADMPDNEKENLKWKYLLEQCKIRIALIYAETQNPALYILNIERANPEEVARKMPVY